MIYQYKFEKILTIKEKEKKEMHFLNIILL